uniref:Uncharacterized protein n=1 Tax=Rhizophora mucronata TaxID=61149 RepID=A0A2P2NGU9_RHIMU
MRRGIQSHVTGPFFAAKFKSKWQIWRCLFL